MALRRKPGRDAGGSKGSGSPQRNSSFKPKPPDPGGRPKGGREVDARKTRKALGKLRRALDAAKAEGADETRKLSPWEEEFAASVSKKLETYGSAFRDPSKGSLEEPLSARQSQKLREIGKKAAGKGGGLKRGSSFKRKEPGKRGGRSRDISAVEEETPPPRKPKR